MFNLAYLINHEIKVAITHKISYEYEIDQMGINNISEILRKCTQSSNTQ